MAAPYHNRLVKFSGRKIRVFDLQPAPFSSVDPIRGALREIDLDGAEPYEALSYVWGTDNPSIPAHLSNATLAVTGNCHAALRRLRDTDRVRPLWIDSICINQADDDEKSHQVTMMSDIYANACRVYVWLGERTDDSDYALDWCVDVSREFFPSLPLTVKISPPMMPWEMLRFTAVVCLLVARKGKLFRAACLPPAA